MCGWLPYRISTCSHVWECSIKSISLFLFHEFSVLLCLSPMLTSHASLSVLPVKLSFRSTVPQYFLPSALPPFSSSRRPVFPVSLPDWAAFPVASVVLMECELGNFLHLPICFSTITPPVLQVPLVFPYNLIISRRQIIQIILITNSTIQSLSLIITLLFPWVINVLCPHTFLHVVNRTVPYILTSMISRKWNLHCISVCLEIS